MMERLSASAFVFLESHDGLRAARGLGQGSSALGSARHLPSA
jgi:hypothetical protein